MSKIESKVIEEYQKIMAADPNSRVFAVLADAYRELNMPEQAEDMARHGIARHPEYAPGYLALAKLFRDQGKLAQAIDLLKKATELAPDNLLAFQLLGEIHLQMRNPKESLRAHKMALFLNPVNPRSREVVRKLEALTADEFEPEIFAMQKLQVATESPPNQQISVPVKRAPEAALGGRDLGQGLERGLSVIDALIVRQQALLARDRLQSLSEQFPGDPQIKARWEMLGNTEELEAPTPIKPLPQREKMVLDRKIKKLRAVLAVLQSP